jgi:hypothetical protein
MFNENVWVLEIRDNGARADFSQMFLALPVGDADKGEAHTQRSASVPDTVTDVNERTRVVRREFSYRVTNDIGSCWII